MSERTLVKSVDIPAPVDRVFDSFSRAENLERLTPPSLRFEILTPLPIEMAPGARIEYRLRLNGIPFRWETEITVWEPGSRFVDVQRKGPYCVWVHEHRFEAIATGTRMTDSLRYLAPGGLFEPLLERLFVRSRVEQIFEFRERAILEEFDRSTAKALAAS
jgi:ligand-binding SRPBCC domain-containing protein